MQTESPVGTLAVVGRETLGSKHLQGALRAPQQREEHPHVAAERIHFHFQCNKRLPELQKAVIRQCADDGAKFSSYHEGPWLAHTFISTSAIDLRRNNEAGN